MRLIDQTSAFSPTRAWAFPGVALAAMLHRDGFAQADEVDATGWKPPDGRPHFAPKAKNVIWLFMIGGTSHLESFDPKPALNRYAGKTIAETPYRRRSQEQADRKPAGAGAGQARAARPPDALSASGRLSETR